MAEGNPRTPVSILCVSNNAEVLNDCLARSVEAHRLTAPETELIVVENSQREFSSAGAALNHGVTLAHNDVCVFVHQDVYLHSLIRLEEAAATLLADRTIGLLGALGITQNGGLAGEIRDRVVLLGRSPNGVADVDSLDEVLFMARRSQLIEDPLSEHSDLAWHAYAVEYGARMKRAGFRVVAGRIPITHNSLTTNLALLSDAHAHISRLYPEQIPIATTCGIVGRVDARRKFLPRHRWRYRWIRGSRQAYLARRAAGPLAVVLSDIRFDIDALLEDCNTTQVTIAALKQTLDLDTAMEQSIVLQRLGCRCSFRVVGLHGLRELLAQREPPESVVATNLSLAALASLRTMLVGQDNALIGFAEPIGFWLIVGPTTAASPAAWRLPSAKPLFLPRPECRLTSLSSTSSEYRGVSIRNGVHPAGEPDEPRFRPHARSMTWRIRRRSIQRPLSPGLRRRSASASPSGAGAQANKFGR